MKKSKIPKGLYSQTKGKPEVSRELSAAEFQELLRQASFAERAKRATRLPLHQTSKYNQRHES
jgi:hypothetical protein